MQGFYFVLLLCAGLTLGNTAHAATLLVANKSEASLSLLRVPGYKEVARLATGDGPHEVAVSPDGRLALVSNYGTRGNPGESLTLVDIPSAATVATTALPSGSKPHGVEWLDNARAVVTAEGHRQLLVVDALRGEITGTINIDQEVAHMVTADPQTGRAFVTNIGSGSTSVANLATGKKLQDIETGAGAEGLALARSGRELWVTNRGDDTLTVIDTTSLDSLATIALEGFPIRAEADDPRGRVYITLPVADALVAISTDSREEVARVNFDIGPDRDRKTLFGDVMPDSSVPIGVMLSTDGELLFVAHTNAHVISVYEADSLQRLAVFPVGLEPDGMAWSPLDANAVKTR